MKPKVKVAERKLGRERAWGLYWFGENQIEIDPRLRGKRRLHVLLHEAFHHLFQNGTENFVEGKSKQVADLLWKQNYRRVDNLKR